MSRRRLFAPMLVLMALGGCAGDGDAASPPPPEPAVPPEEVVVEAPARYHVVYRIEDGAAGAPVVSTEKIWVERPFASRVERFEGPPPGRSLTSASVADFGRFANLGPDSAPLVTGAAPAVAPADLRLDVTLPALVRSGAASIHDTRQHNLGRCVVVRVGEPLGTDELPPATTDDHADACVDRHGLVLEERWLVGGELLRLRTAVHVEVNGEIEDERFAVEDDPIGPDAGGVGLTTLAPGADGGGWELPSPPPGFDLRGRYVLRTGRPPVPGGPAAPPDEAIVHVYTDGGIRFLTIWQGAHEERPRARPRWSRPVTAGALRDAWQRAGAYGNEIIGRTDATRALRVAGPVPLPLLAWLAASLKPPAGPSR